MSPGCGSTGPAIEPPTDAPIELSIVVVAYDMQREAVRTVRSLRPPYQRCVAAEAYDVIVVDNGSPVPLRLDGDLADDPGVRLITMRPPVSASPAAALNFGVSQSAGRLIGMIVDGARMASPGLVRLALTAARLSDDPLVASLAWHLGPDTQARSVRNGYDRGREDALLESIGWPEQGERLFEVAHPAPASGRGYLLPLPESSAVFLRRNRFDALGGLDERFATPGGGLVASDFWRRAVERSPEPPIVLLGEGTFHQLHGPAGTADLAGFHAEYERLTGRRFEPPAYEPMLVGQVSPRCAPWLGRSAVLAAAAGRATAADATSPLP